MSIGQEYLDETFVASQLAMSIRYERQTKKKDPFGKLSNFKDFYERTRKKSYFKGDMQEVNNLLFFNAAQNGKHEIVKFLLSEEKADVNAVDKDKKSALHLVMLVEDNVARKNTIKQLLSKNINFGRKDEDGNTSLHSAVILKRPDSVKQLLAHKGMYIKTINKQNEKGRTAFMEAGDNGEYRSVKVLAERGADVNIRDDKGKTALHLVVEKNSENMINLLLSLSPAKGKPVLLLPDEQGQTPVHYAVKQGNPKIVTMLLDKDAKWFKNVPDKDKVFALLVNSQDKKEQTPLDLAFGFKKPGWWRIFGEYNNKMKKIIKILKKNGGKLERELAIREEKKAKTIHEEREAKVIEELGTVLERRKFRMQ